jgi:hypothetical protein
MRQRGVEIDAIDLASRAEVASPHREAAACEDSDLYNVDVAP